MLYRETYFVLVLSLNKERNIIETKQQKSKSNRKSKAVEYTLFEDKFQMLEYTTFQRVKGLVSYSKFPFKKWIS